MEQIFCNNQSDQEIVLFLLATWILACHGCYSASREVLESHQLKLSDLNNGSLFEEITFGLFELESSLLELLEDDLNVFEMFLLILAENDDVI